MALAFSLACGLAPVKVEEIERDPTRFEDKVVTLHGTARGGTKLPFMQESFYEIDDGTGSLPVVTTKALPAEGKKVFVRGRVKSAFRLGGKSYGLVVMEGN
jgi:hypothetical protein